MGDPVFQFLHAADLHLDTQPDGLHGYPEVVADDLRDASLAAFGRLIDTAIEREVAFCCFAGDVYDGAVRGLRAELAVRDGLSRLADAGIRSFIVHGNHDPVESGWSTVAEWPSAVTVFAPGTPQTVRVDVDGISVAVHGVSFATRATTENLALGFERDDSADVNVGVLHANVGGRPGHDPYSPCTVDQLTDIGLDYWALGHIHSREIVRAGNPWIVYPGNTQGRHPKPAEQGAKGAMIVTVDGSSILEPEFVPLDVTRFVSSRITIDDLSDAGELRDACVEAVDELTAEHQGRPLVYRAELTGRGPVHHLLADRAARDDLLTALREDGLRRHPYVWWDRLDDRTSPDVDVDQLAAQNDFTGHALRWFDGRVPADELRAMLPNFDRLDVHVPDPTDPELLARARATVARLLTGDGRP